MLILRTCGCAGNDRRPFRNSERSSLRWVMICVNLFREWVCSAAVVLVNRTQIWHRFKTELAEGPMARALGAWKEAKRATRVRGEARLSTTYVGKTRKSIYNLIWAHMRVPWPSHFRFYIGVESAPSIILDVSPAELLSDIWEGIHHISDLSLDQSYTLNEYWSHLRCCIRYIFQQHIPGQALLIILPSSHCTWNKMKSNAFQRIHVIVTIRMRLRISSCLLRSYHHYHLLNHRPADLSGA